jgi:hypothetical protein
MYESDSDSVERDKDYESTSHNMVKYHLIRSFKWACTFDTIPPKISQFWSSVVCQTHKKL